MSIHLFSTSDGARCEIHENGAHITSWILAGGAEQLFLSPRSGFGPGASIRGGAPVIFPQFNAWGPYARHGFARRVPWTYLGTEEQSEEHVRARFELHSNLDTLVQWPFTFRCELVVTLGEQTLEIGLRVENPGEAPFTFSAALHTYFLVANLERVRLLGLQRAAYQEWAGGAQGQVRGIQAEEEFTFTGEVDRIYFGAPAELILREPGRELAIGQRGFTDTVVWNPGEEKGQALKDLEPGGWKKFVCVEAAVIDPPVRLEAGEAWIGAQVLTAS